MSTLRTKAQRETALVDNLVLAGIMQIQGMQPVQIPRTQPFALKQGGRATSTLPQPGSGAQNFCDACGQSNTAAAQFCRRCGNPLGAQVTSGVPLGQTGLLIANNFLQQGRYMIERRVGMGGMGAVYKGLDLWFTRPVAIKEMSQSTLSLQELAVATKAFEQERKLLEGLNHPSLPHVYDSFSEGGRAYFVMDFIEGQTLEGYLATFGVPVDPSDPHSERYLPVEEAIKIGDHLGEALEYLHSQKPHPIIFRDLKPSNVIRTPSGGIVLVDFGIARFFKPGQKKDTEALGTEGYAAPEQYGSDQTTMQTDIYGLGAMLYQLISGHDPKENTPTIFHFLPLSNPHQPVPVILVDLIGRMVELNPGKRPASIAVVRKELISALQPPSVTIAAHPATNTRATARSSSTGRSPDTSIYVISAPLVSQQDGKSYPDDQNLLDSLRSILAPIEQEVQAKGKIFAYRDALSQGKLREQFQKFEQEATVVLILMTPSLLASQSACNLVESALDEEYARGGSKRKTLPIIPVVGIGCNWAKKIPSLAPGRGRVSAPVDGTPIVDLVDWTKFQQKLRRDLGSLILDGL